MELRSGLLLLVVAVICAELPFASSFAWTKEPKDPTVVFVDKNHTSVVLRWDYDVNQGSGTLVLIKVAVFATTVASEVTIKRTYPRDNGRLTLTPNNKNEYWYLDVYTPAEGAPNQKGWVQITIRDVLKQGIDGDGNKIEVLKKNYTYIVDPVTRNPGNLNLKRDIVLVAWQPMKFTEWPTNTTVSSTGGIIELKCPVVGTPPARITWEKIGDSKFNATGAVYQLTDFQRANTGVYRCTADNWLTPNITAVAIIQYNGLCQENCPSTEVGIQMTGLTWDIKYATSNLYSDAMMDLKKRIEYETHLAYIKQNVKLDYVEVTRFREGSVVAVVKLRQSSGSVVNKAPLEQAIRSGAFAGQTVNTALVSPTPAPTTRGPTTSTTESTGTPGSGARTDSGLSDGELIAIIAVVGVIVLILVIVVIIWVIKRKKPADTRKGRYQQDSAPKGPYKSPSNQPKNQDHNMYDNANQNRYPNGEGNYPPPQYEQTPYAEVSHAKPAGKDDSEVEWDKSVNDGMWI